MFLSKSITFGDEGLTNAATAHSVDELSGNDRFVEQLKAGDATAFDLLITRYSPDVYSLLFRLTRDTEEAADLTQDTFLRVLRSIRKFRGDSELKTWIFRIAINESRNRFRWWTRRKRGRTVSIDEPLTKDGPALANSLAGASEAPDERLIRRESRSRLERAIADLSPAFRETIVLCDIEGQSYQEIALILGISLGTVKSRIARARDELRKKLKDF